MKKLTRCMLVALLLMCLVLPTAALADVNYEDLPECYRYLTPGEARVATGARVAVYDGSDVSAKLVSSVGPNDVLYVEQVSTIRSFIRTALLPNGGWVPNVSIVNSGIAKDAMFVYNPNIGKRVNMRAQPKENSERLGAYYTGTVVTLVNGYQPIDKYVLVRIGDVEGYMHTNYLRSGDLPRQHDMPTLLVWNKSNSGAAMYSGPSQQTYQVGYVGNMERVTVLGIRANGWYHVMYNGVTGFVNPNGVSELLVSGTYPPASDAYDPNKMYVVSSKPGNRVNLRINPDKNNLSYGKYYTGTEVLLIEDENPIPGYLRVQIGYVKGYMDVNYLTHYPTDFTSEVRIGRISNPDGAFLYKWNNSTDEVTGYMYYNQPVTIIGVTTSCVHVVCEDTHGYLLTSDVEFTP